MLMGPVGGNVLDVLVNIWLIISRSSFGFPFTRCLICYDAQGILTHKFMLIQRDIHTCKCRCTQKHKHATLHVCKHTHVCKDTHVHACAHRQSVRQTDTHTHTFKFCWERHYREMGSEEHYQKTEEPRESVPTHHKNDGVLSSLLTLTPRTQVS